MNRNMEERNFNGDFDDDSNPYNGTHQHTIELYKNEDVEEAVKFFVEYFELLYSSTTGLDTKRKASSLMNSHSERIEELFVLSKNIDNVYRKFNIKVCNNMEEFSSKIKEVAKKLNSYLENSEDGKICVCETEKCPAYVISGFLIFFYTSLIDLYSFIINLHPSTSPYEIDSALNDYVKESKTFYNKVVEMILEEFKDEYLEKHGRHVYDDIVELTKTFRILHYTIFSLVDNFYKAYLKTKTSNVVGISDIMPLKNIVNYFMNSIFNQRNYIFFEKVNSSYKKCGLPGCCGSGHVHDG